MRIGISTLCLFLGLLLGEVIEYNVNIKEIDNLKSQVQKLSAMSQQQQCTGDRPLLRDTK